MEIYKQKYPGGTPAILYAVANGYLKDLPIAKIPEFEKRLQEFMEAGSHYEVLAAIRQSGKLEPETEEKLKQAIEALLKEFNP